VTPQRVDYFSFSYLAGFRYIYLRETMNLAFTKQEETSNYKVKAQNHLYGPQLGFVLEVNPTRCFSWLFQIKGAGFFNSVESDVFLGDIGNTITLKNYDKKKWTDSWLIEGYGQLAYHPTSFLDIHIGYSAFLLAGLVLAPEQRDIHPSSRRFISDIGQIVIDGGRAGITLTF